MPEKLLDFSATLASEDMSHAFSSAEAMAQKLQETSCVLVAVKKSEYDDGQQFFLWHQHGKHLTTPEKIETVAGMTFNVLQFLARHPWISEKVMREIALHESKFIRGALSMNESLPADLLATLSRDEEDWVRAISANNKKLSDDDFERLRLDPIKRVRDSVQRVSMSRK